MEKNGEITLAILGNEMSHIKNDVRDIKKILTRGSSKISDNRTDIAKVGEKLDSAISWSWKIGGVITVVVTILSFIIRGN